MVLHMLELGAPGFLVPYRFLLLDVLAGELVAPAASERRLGAGGTLRSDAGPRDTVDVGDPASSTFAGRGILAEFLQALLSSSLDGCGNFLDGQLTGHLRHFTIWVFLGW